MASTATGRRRLTARGEERRRQLLDFATERFAENGYHPTSVAEIVQGLGVGKGVFYWYFESKEELFLEILKEAQTDLRRTQQQAIADVDDPIRRIELGNLQLDLRADWDRTSGRARQKRFQATQADGIIGVREIGLVEIQHNEQRFSRQELKSAQPLRVVAAEIERAQRTSFFERRAASKENLLFLPQIGVVALLQIPFEALEAAFDDAKVREDDLIFHRAHIARGIDRS